MVDQRIPPATDADRRPPAPGRLELLRSFINTVDIEGGEDDFATPDALAAWLAARGLLPAGRRLDEHDRREAIGFREALRDVLEGHAGHRVASEAGRRLDRIAAGAPLRVRFSGETRLEPEPDGLAPAIGGLLAIAYDAMADGTWERLKVCRSDTCRWAFYDSSRNRSGAWCTMAICGNRMKGRAFRRRQAAGSGAAG